MPSLETLALFLVAALVVIASPGPSNLYVMARSVAQGMRGGLLATLGLSFGGLAHVAGAALGLSIIFQYSPLLFTIVKVVGAIYLIWLGLGMILRRGGAETDDPAGATRGHKSDRRILVESALVELLNPKVALFFMAFLPQFVDTGAGAIALQSFVLGFVFVLVALCCDGAYALAAGRAADLLRRSATARRIQDWISGSALIGLGAWMAASTRD